VVKLGVIDIGPMIVDGKVVLNIPGVGAPTHAADHTLEKELELIPKGKTIEALKVPP
jgi:hypothetical protein